MTHTSPKIGIYAGSGTSHSWLWFVDLFEKAGFFNLYFLDEDLVRDQGLTHLDVLVISGGDTFAVAEALGEKGAKKIEGFVAQGGLYIGSCAGAYLPMKSSKKPLDLFNFVDVKITNLSKILPDAAIPTCKFCTSYGCDYIFHPVREAVALKTKAKTDTDRTVSFDAPLYGGPGMMPQDPSWTLAAYEGFTPRTLFLTSKEIADNTLVGQGAVVRVPFESGCFYLLGPHLEHPGYKKANQFIIDAVLRETDIETFAGQTDDFRTPASTYSSSSAAETIRGKEARDKLLPIKRELSNSRITAGGLEFLRVQWLIGKKVYEPQKIRVYLESMWKRIRPLEKNKALVLKPGLYEKIVEASSQMTLELRRLKQLVDEKHDSLESAVIIFDLLHSLAISFFELYFETLFNKEGRYREDKVMQA